MYWYGVLVPHVRVSTESSTVYLSVPQLQCIKDAPITHLTLTNASWMIFMDWLFMHFYCDNTSYMMYWYVMYEELVLLCIMQYYFFCQFSVELFIINCVSPSCLEDFDLLLYFTTFGNKSKCFLHVHVVHLLVLLLWNCKSRNCLIPSCLNSPKYFTVYPSRGQCLKMTFTLTGNLASWA